MEKRIMPTETITYPNESAWRTGLNGRRGWKIIGNSKTKLDIIWNNDPPPAPPPRRQLTERQALEELLKGTDIDLV